MLKEWIELRCCSESNSETKYKKNKKDPKKEKKKKVKTDRNATMHFTAPVIFNIQHKRVQK